MASYSRPARGGPIIEEMPLQWDIGTVSQLVLEGGFREGFYYLNIVFLQYRLLLSPMFCVAVLDTTQKAILFILYSNAINIHGMNIRYTQAQT